MQNTPTLGALAKPVHFEFVADCVLFSNDDKSGLCKVSVDQYAILGNGIMQVSLSALTTHPVGHNPQLKPQHTEHEGRRKVGRAAQVLTVAAQHKFCQRQSAYDFSDAYLLSSSGLVQTGAQNSLCCWPAEPHS